MWRDELRIAALYGEGGGQSAVDEDVGAGDEGGEVAGEVEDGVGDVAGGAEDAQGCAGGGALAVGGVGHGVLGHGGEDHAGADRIDSDAGGAEFAGELPGEGQDGSLGGGVGGEGEAG